MLVVVLGLGLRGPGRVFLLPYEDQGVPVDLRE
jgi:hypothetical protein